MAKHNIYLGVSPDVNPLVYVSFLTSRVVPGQVYISATDHAVHPLLPGHYEGDRTWNCSEGFRDRILTKLEATTGQAIVCVMDIRCFTVVLRHYLHKDRTNEIGLEFDGKIVLYSHDLDRFCRRKKLQMRTSFVPKSFSEQLKDITDRVKVGIIGSEVAPELINRIGNRLDGIMNTDLEGLEEELHALERYANQRISRLSADLRPDQDTVNGLQAAQTQMERISHTLVSVKSALETQNGEEERKQLEEEVSQLEMSLQQFPEQIQRARNLFFTEKELPVHLMLLPDQRLLAINFKPRPISDVILQIEIAGEPVQNFQLIRPLSTGPEILDFDGREFAFYHRMKIMLKTEQQLLSNPVEVWNEREDQVETTHSLRPRRERRPISSQEPDLSRSEAASESQFIVSSYQDQSSVIEPDLVPVSASQESLNAAVSSFEDSYPPLLPPSEDLTRLFLPEEQQLLEELRTDFSDLATMENLHLRFLAAVRCAGDIHNKDRIVAELLGIE